MDLAEAGADVVLDHHVGPRHRLLGRQRLPGIGTEMVPTEQDAIASQADAIGNTIQVTEVGRCHAGIAAVLVDLVRGRFDQRERCARLPGMEERRLDRQRMREHTENSPHGSPAL